MSKNFVLDAEDRTIIGKKVKQLRRDGLVPAVIYGLGDAESVQLNFHKTMLALRDANSNEVFTLNLNGQERKVMARQVQRHVVRRDLIHIDFQEVNEDSIIRTRIPLKGIGRSAPESEGLGRTLMIAQYVEVEATLKTLVNEIEVDLSFIDKPSRVFRVRDLVAPEGIKVTSAPMVTVAKFAAKRGEVVETEDGEEAAAAEA